MIVTTINARTFEAYGRTLKQRCFTQTAKMAHFLQLRGDTVTFLALIDETDTSTHANIHDGADTDADLNTHIDAGTTNTDTANTNNVTSQAESDSYDCTLSSIRVAALVYTQHVTGGAYMNIYDGPIYDDEQYLPAFYEGLRDYAHRPGVLELIVKPYTTYQTFDGNGDALNSARDGIIETFTRLGYQHDGLHNDYHLGIPSWYFVKDLSNLTQDTLIPSFSKKRQGRIKKAHTFGITIRCLSRSELSVFKDITAATSDRRHFHDHSLQTYEYYYDAWGDDIEFVVAELNFAQYAHQLQQDRPALASRIEDMQQLQEEQALSSKQRHDLHMLTQQLASYEKREQECVALVERFGDTPVVLAGALFIYTPQEAFYLFSGSYSEFSKFYAPTLIQEYAMRQALKRNIGTYNFLGITGDFSVSNGVLEFKRSFTGYVERKPGTFRYYPRPLRYRLLQFAKRCLHR